MWEPRDPREPRSLTGSRLRQVEMQHSRLAHWPPPQRDTVTPPAPLPPPVAAREPAKPPAKRGWQLMRKLFSYK